ncbi:hypothetical protein STCU_10506 [Strigomonas culicis]|uniref:Spastin/Vps4 C-terminal domain-containing protein n=1 Tax=Strigomonas culicis TaxID=28005 RepID=S9TMQ5_9TRYP|nr:hypothetical protein STCU_10506 [Strigomonas culicis]|eukprot:EPY17613.1 hypothetical protein STCU_10506 [Strigomonas culicis]
MSAADVDVVCREAMMRPVRKMIERLEGVRQRTANAQQARLELEQLKLSQESRVTVADVEASIGCTKTSVRKEDLQRYEVWTAQYGSGMST